MVRKEASADERSEEKRGRWRRLLAFGLILCLLMAPFAKRAARKISGLYEVFIQQRTAANEAKARANRVRHPPIELTEEMRRGVLYAALEQAQDVCFVGDSITKGPSSNGWVPWFEPLEGLVRGTVTNCGWGGATVQILLDRHMDDIAAAKADLYVVAIGTNDVMHRNPETCAMDAQSYIEKLTALREGIRSANSKAAFVFIAPWYSVDDGSAGEPSYAELSALYSLYAEALESWAGTNGDGFIDPNPYLQQVFARGFFADYMADSVHPSGDAGVELYSRAVLLYQNETEKSERR